MGPTDYANIRRPNQGFDACGFFKSDFQPISACRNSDKPEYLVWGDSFAMHLVPGLLASNSGTPAILQAAGSMCGPIIGMAVARSGDDAIPWTECLRFNDSVLSYLKSSDTVRIVILSSPFIQFLHPDNRLMVRDVDGSMRTIGGDDATAVATLKKTVDSVRALNKKVVVVAGPPVADSDVSRCLERILTGKPTIVDDDQCSINIAHYHQQSAPVLEFLSELPTKAGVDVVNFDSFLCTPAVCRTMIDGVVIYRDALHFSEDGSRYVGEHVRLLEQINRKAR
jgi:hypothetical protein